MKAPVAIREAVFVKTVKAADGTPEHAFYWPEAKSIPSRTADMTWDGVVLTCYQTRKTSQGSTLTVTLVPLANITYMTVKEETK